MSAPATTQDDPEVRAVLALVKYLGPLDQAACKRVLDWGQERFVRQSIPYDPAWLSQFTDALAEAARQMGDITPLDIVKAAEEIAHLRAEARAAEAATSEPEPSA